MKKSCAVTGPKPTRFKFGYKEDYSLCKKIKKAMLEQFKRLYHEKGVRRFYIGGAMGVHIWAGELVLQLRGQPSPENYAKQNRYLVDHADFLVAVSDGEGEMVGYARKKKMSILRIHPDTAAVDGDVWGDGA